ncbi:uncharacterized protein LOC129297549 [Prosopis cineraria]|uniref:uncharacterized protein LOC129297549 n=1 Tax=Prosopis cineraria TaxID=364024 RepID=UPI0024108CCB|nr:uncharacterized protein LOC129297549 [Prosopis cineraria]
MEPAKIDWKRLEWHFVEDEKYEHINAPKWVDFLAPDQSVDDEDWFCRPDCKHPKTVDDFLRSTPSKLLSSVDSPGILPLGDQNRRDQKLKRRVPTLSSASPDGKLKFKHDSENQNPNLVTPPSNNPLKLTKASIKSSDEKKRLIDDTSQHNKVPSLRSTLSAKNLFAGRPILSQITEFCNELKKLATRGRERENDENVNEIKSEEGEENQKANEGPPPVQPSEQSVKEEKERKPLLEVTGKSEARNNKPKLQRKKRADETENMPIMLDLENVRRKKDENLMQIRTNPPSPQCFSAIRDTNKTTPPKASKSRLMERGILQEVEQKKTMEFPENSSQDISIVDGKEARALDVFWFLKPCTLSS